MHGNGNLSSSANFGANALLVLRDGTVFPGSAIGASAQTPAVGELVFNTSMTGYQEALTDPSYAGQVLLFTYPLIGNYGISAGAFESEKIHCNAVVVSEACEKPVHCQSKLSFNEFLQQQGVAGIEGCDTRAIVRKIRGEGVMPCAIMHLQGKQASPEHLQQAVAVALSKMGSFDYGKIDFVRQVATKGEVVFQPQNSSGKSARIVLVDCGAKRGIVNELLARGNQVVLVPPDTSVERILSHKPDGIVLSNGPGDPTQMQYLVAQVKQLLGKTPIFGICLGHQILAHALGANTFKLKFGHRGSNHPVQNTETGRVFISAQNHGYAVSELPSIASEWFVNAYDGTNEGLRCEQLRAMSVQYHPEANPGPYDNNYLFDEFLKTI